MLTVQYARGAAPDAGDERVRELGRLIAVNALDAAEYILQHPTEDPI